MIIIAHRINKIEELKKIPADYGVEIDIRHDNRSNGLYLNHEAGIGDDLEEYLKNFHHQFVIFNTKETGIEQKILDLAKKYNIPKENYFLLDVEFPYLYKASRRLGVKEIAVRYSEAEPIEMTLAQSGFVNWVWIDVNTKLPLDPSIIEKLKGFKTCLVSPECWGRPEDIEKYQKQMRELNFWPDAVMTDLEYAKLWE